MNLNFYKFVSYIILLIATNPLVAQTPKLIPYRDGAMYGYCNEAKKIIIPLKYEETGVFKYGYAPVKLNGKWGLIDSLGKIAIPCNYEETSIFKYGYAKVKSGGKWGLLDFFGKTVIPCNYEELSIYLNKIVVAKNTLKNYGVLNLKGEVVLPFDYSIISNFYNDMAMVRKKDTLKPYKTFTGFIDETGIEIIPCVYEDTTHFINGHAIVKLNGKFGLIDTLGKIIIPFEYDELVIASKKIIIAYNSNSRNKAGVLNFKGEIIIPFKYWYIKNFYEGLAQAIKIDSVATGKKSFTGFINDKGVEVIPCIYEEASNFSNGLAAVSIKKHFEGYINNKGIMVIPEKYYYAGDFKDGNAIIYTRNSDGSRGSLGIIDTLGNEILLKNSFEIYNKFDGIYYIRTTDEKNKKQFGCIDSKGKEIAPLGKYYQIQEFKNGFAKVVIKELNGENSYALLNKQGKVVVPFGKYYMFYQNLDSTWIVSNAFYRGYLNKKLEEITPIKYQEAWPFENGLGRVKINDKVSYINTKGEQYFKDPYNLVLNFNYESAGSFHKGKAFVGKNIRDFNMIGSFAIMDTNGVVLTDYNFTQWVNSDYINGYCQILGNKNSQGDFPIGFINLQGKVIVQPKYEGMRISKFNKSGYAPVCYNKKWGVIDTTGKEVVPLKYDDMNSMSGNIVGTYFAQLKLWGFINTKDSMVIPPKYLDIKEFSGDPIYYCVKDSATKKWGFIDKIGVWKIKPSFDDAGEIASNGLISVKKDKLWGFINATGAIVIPYQFDEISLYGFTDGVVSVKKQGKFGVIDKTGKIIINYSDSVKYHYDLLGGNFIYSNGIFYNTKGVVVFKTPKNPEFNGIDYYPTDKSEGFLNGYLRVSKNGVGEFKRTDGIIDNKGKFIIELGNFEEIGSLPVKKTDFFPVKQNKKWGYIKFGD